MNVESMRYFTELARAGSFYRAAKSLFISQQGLNKAITAVESELGVRLLERSRRGVELTADGERFLKLSESVTAQVDEFLGSIYGAQDVPQAGADPLTIHVTYYSAQIAAASQDYVNLLEGTAYLEEPFEKILHRVRSSEDSELSFVDLHGLTAAEVLSDPALTFEPAITTQVGIVCRKDSHLADEPSLRRSEICGLTMGVNAFREMAQLLDWLFRDHPLSDVRMSAASPKMLLRFAQSSPENVALYDSFGFHLAAHDAESPTDGLTFIPLLTPEARCYVGFVYSKRVRPAPRAVFTARSLANHIRTCHNDYFDAYPLGGKL